eukprot:scaffold2360_cov380-Prasinococcus_capsulatus_cf.AAC.9
MAGDFPLPTLGSFSNVRSKADRDAKASGQHTSFSSTYHKELEEARELKSKATQSMYDRICIALPPMRDERMSRAMSGPGRVKASLQVVQV